VLVKGGHLEGEVVDILYDGRALHEFRSERIDTRHTHGTGCTLSSAIAACLALGMKVPEAVGTARDYVARAIGSAPGLGAGSGPLNHGIGPVLPEQGKGG
jgi:hydroxymethylpyrimidine kinase/phosphomethylpyrimidine kinase